MRQVRPGTELVALLRPPGFGECHCCVHWRDCFTQAEFGTLDIHFLLLFSFVGSLAFVLLLLLLLQECLEDHMDESGFSDNCRAALEEVIEMRVKDFRWDIEQQPRNSCPGSVLWQRSRQQRCRGNINSNIFRQYDSVQWSGCCCRISGVRTNAARQSLQASMLLLESWLEAARCWQSEGKRVCAASSAREQDTCKSAGYTTWLCMATEAMLASVVPYYRAWLPGAALQPGFTKIAVSCEIAAAAALFTLLL